MINTVIFDIGMVLMGWHPELTGRFDFPESVLSRVRYAIFESGLWSETDLGVKDDEEVFQEMRALDPEVKTEIDYVLNHMDRIMEKYEYALPFVLDLKKRGYQVYYLSNYPKHLKERFPEALYFIPYMDGGIFSSDIRMVKPEKDIYLALLEKYHLSPETCLFIDDRKENAEGAEKVQMKGFHFRSYEEDYNRIMSLLDANR